jgi:hypothetical protein
MLTPYNLAPAGALIAPIDYSILVSLTRVLVKFRSDLLRTEKEVPPASG